MGEKARRRLGGCGVAKIPEPQIFNDVSIHD
jgi:hypothetical protein